MLYDLESDKRRWYGRDLQRQIHEKERQREMEREVRLRSERECLWNEVQNDPFGRSGSGAPLRD
jgi:hypothetical protein